MSKQSRLSKDEWINQVSTMLTNVQHSIKKEKKVEQSFELFDFIFQYPEYWKNYKTFIKVLKNKLAIFYYHYHELNRHTYIQYTNRINTIIGRKPQCLSFKVRRKKVQCVVKDDFTINLCKNHVHKSGDRCHFHQQIINVIDHNVQNGIDIAELISSYSEM